MMPLMSGFTTPSTHDADEILLFRQCKNTPSDNRQGRRSRRVRPRHNCASRCGRFGCAEAQIKEAF
jgi:hypothetical protein